MVGEVWLKAPWVRVAFAALAAGVASGLGGACLVLLLHVVQHGAFGYDSGSFLAGSEHASGARRVAALAVGGALAGASWWWLRRGGSRPSVASAVRGDADALPFWGSLGEACVQIASVGAGASLGREGAPRLVGASFAARVAAGFGLDAGQSRLLIACGAGAGLGAVYDVPFGGALFTAEVLLTSLHPRVLGPAVLASVAATVVAWPVVGRSATYAVGRLHATGGVLVWALLAGPVLGVAAALFTRVMTAARDRAPHGWVLALTVPLAFTAVGVVSMAYPQILGNGKGPAQLAFQGRLPVALLCALLVLKPVATAVCLRGGAAGGLLTPAVAVGALLGAGGGAVWDTVAPGGQPQLYAVIGAGAVLAATLDAPLTGTVLMVEFTHASLVALAPLILAVAGAWLTAHALAPERVRPDAP